MKMADVARSMMKRFRTDTGASVYGEFVKPNTRTPPDNFDLPRRIFRTGLKSNVGVGSVIKTADGRFYLLGLHDDDETNRLTLRNFRAIEVPDLLSWERLSTVEDLVTGLTRDQAKVELGTIRCVLERPGSVKEINLLVRKSTFRVVTAADVQLGDILDRDKKVVAVNKLLGLVYLEVE
jgi:hypothetical protein